MRIEREERRRLRAENKRLREVNEVLKAATISIPGEPAPPKLLIVAFTDQMRATGYADESILTALEQAGPKIAARTLRAGYAPAGPSNVAAPRTVTDALVEDSIRRPAGLHHQRRR
ncbi:hypothetical protein [Streptomyces sp. NPDC088748]|uniref:hypothetical protein n=1 Tax=Streptomyces sp. NPDC088748 TaxID=3365887 RepID=UPI00380DC3CE